MTLIAIDFDKTLAAETPDPYSTGGERPDGEMVEFVRSLKEDKQYDIIVWTARPWSHASHIAGLLTMWEVPFNGIMCEKGGANAYVDDRAVNHNLPDWQQRVYGLADHDNQDPTQRVLGEYEDEDEQRPDPASA